MNTRTARNRNARKGAARVCERVESLFSAATREMHPNMLGCIPMVVQELEFFLRNADLVLCRQPGSWINQAGMRADGFRFDWAPASVPREPKRRVAQRAPGDAIPPVCTFEQRPFYEKSICANDCQARKGTGFWNKHTAFCELCVKDAKCIASPGVLSPIILGTDFDRRENGSFCCLGMRQQMSAATAHGNSGK